METNRIEKIEGITLKQLGFKEREHLQEGIENNPSCLNEDLLIIQKEFDGFYDKIRANKKKAWFGYLSYSICH